MEKKLDQRAIECIMAVTDSNNNVKAKYLFYWQDGKAITETEKDVSKYLGLIKHLRELETECEKEENKAEEEHKKYLDEKVYSQKGEPKLTLLECETLHRLANRPRNVRKAYLGKFKEVEQEIKKYKEKIEKLL
jgi:hypothetical protein